MSEISLDDLSIFDLIEAVDYFNNVDNFMDFIKSSFLNLIFEQLLIFESFYVYCKRNMF